MPKQDSQLAVWDFTLSEALCPNRQDLVKFLRGWAKKWAFQLEEGDSGYRHWQGRLSLIKPRRKTQLLKLWAETTFAKASYNFTSNKCKGEELYVLKEDTRVEGPWTDQDIPPYIPRQIRECEGLRPFQQQIVDSVDVWDKRTINYVHCPEGNKGKSILVGYLRAHQLARALPLCNDYKDVLRMVYCLPTSRCYLVDCPRAIKKDKMYQFYSALETIKDGYAYDDRYVFKEKVFDCPNIWVFGNSMPETFMLSMDRWKFWRITDDYRLEAIEVNS